MGSERKNRLNSLLAAWPPGAVGTQAWLSSLGVYDQLGRKYASTGWLNRIGHGAYARPGDAVEWTGGVYALQAQLGLQVHVGAKTALELRGLGHFAALGHGAYVYLFGEPQVRLPPWFARYEWGRRIAYKMPRLFTPGRPLALTSYVTGRLEVQISSPERAIMEALHLAPKEQSLSEARLLMEGLTTLRPKVVQELLERCTSVKVKRLFLCLEPPATD